jgi:signal transduction histidine kinase|tara:strand:- start:51 stop:1508 length:1458 start_codon:yes stop_codon:yes gene_type:complete
MALFFPNSLPRSLLGQSLLAIAVTLLIGQAVSGLLLYRAAQDRRDTATANAAAFHLLRMVNRDSDSPRDIRRALRRAGPDGRIDIGRGRGERRRGLPPRLSGMVSDTSPLLPGERRAPREEAQLREILARQGIAPEALVVAIRPAADDPLLDSVAEDFPRFGARWRDGLDEREVMVAALRMPGETRWIVARALRPALEGGVLWLIAAQTVLLFLVLLAATYFVLRRITHPLARLTERVESFAHTHEARAPLPSSGPEDVSRLIAAHNLLEHRIGALLDEKDVMLGAIGHDLKTPLAALRVRIESVPDKTQRARMAEVIEDLRRSLDDILSLARIGRAKDPPEATQLAALVESVVEEFEDMDRPVGIGRTERIVAPVQVTWLRRALRNLIENALRYGGTAQVSLTREGGTAVIGVEDEGPGIPQEDMAAMLEPFRRGEASRNRGTGGAGLGLTLTRAILAEHGGELRLANRPQGGLRAEMRLPLAD